MINIRLMQLKDLLNPNLHRYIFFVSNTIFWCCGWGALAVGIWLYTQKNLYSTLAPASYSAMSAAGLCVSMGSMVLIISFIGCLGSWLKSKCLLISFFCFVLLLFLVQCMTGLMGYMRQEVVRERAKVNLRHTINFTHGDDTRSVLLWNTWNQMQTDLNCCGADNYTDWFFYPRWKGKRFVPDSCCDRTKFNTTLSNSTLNCGKSTRNYELLYTTGCAVPFTEWLLQHLHIVGMIALLFSIIELIVLVTSLRLVCNLHTTAKKSRHSITRYKYTRSEVDGSLILADNTGS